MLRQAVADAYPAVAGFQFDLANGLNETGDVLRVLGEMGEARASYERALTTPSTRARRSRRNDCAAWLLQGLKVWSHPTVDGRVAEAVGSWRRAVAIGDPCDPITTRPCIT